MKFQGIHLTVIKFIAMISLIFPITVFAHLISITATTAFPPVVAPSSFSTASFTVTNITSKISLIVVDQSRFPKGCGLAITSTTCGSLMTPGQTCLINVQFNAPLTPHVIYAELREWASPSADGVRYPLVITVAKPQFTITPTVGVAIDNSGNNSPLAYITRDEGHNWTLSSALLLPAGQPQGELFTVACVTSTCTTVGESFQNGLINQLPLAYASSDGGSSWTLSAPLPLPTGQTEGILFGGTCVANRCTAVGQSMQSASINVLPVAYTSSNSGNNWLLSAALPLPGGQPQGTLNSVACVGNSCTTVGESFQSGFNAQIPLVYTSSNGGSNWTLSPAFTLPIGQTQGQLIGVTCIGSHCTVVGASFDINNVNALPLAYTSNDGGVNWTLASTFPLPSGRLQGELFGVTCIGSNCVAVGESFQSFYNNPLPLAYTSSDGGSNWTLSSPFPLPAGQTEGILFGTTCTNNTCIAAGQSLQSGFINQLPLAYTSIDGGSNWTLSSAFPLPIAQTQGILFGVAGGSGLRQHP